MSQPGWYPNSANPNAASYWSGTQWTAQRSWNGAEWVYGATPAPPPPMRAGLAAPAPAPAPAATGYPPPGYPPPAGYPPSAGLGGPANFPFGGWDARPGARYQSERKYSNRLIMTLVGAGLVVIGCLMPWAEADGLATVSGTSVGGGEADVVLGLIVATLCVLGMTGRIGIKGTITNFWLAVLITVIVIGNIASLSHLIDANGGADSGISVGMGLIMVLIGGCLASVGTLLTWLEARKLRKLGR